MQRTDGKVLLVEDDAELAAALATKFVRNSFELIHAATGLEGLELARTYQPDVMILDLMLPDIPGEQVLEQVRQRSTVPVVIVSAKSEERHKIEGLHKGADDYITKPLSPKELVARVQAVLRRSRMMPDNGDGHNGAWAGSVLRAGDIEVCLEAREARAAGRDLGLTPTEFNLLRAFVERAGSALSIEQIIKAVWGYDGYDRHIVEANIYRLRTKLEDDPGTPQRLLTVRGFGYKLAVPIGA